MSSIDLFPASYFGTPALRRSACYSDTEHKVSCVSSKQPVNSTLYVVGIGYR